MKRIVFRGKYWRESPKNVLREIRWFIQRGLRGYADCDIWSLDHYLGTWLPSALREVGVHSGPTCNMYPGAPDDIARKFWREDIEMMARAWEEAAKVCDHEYFDKDLMDLGLHSFADNINALWT